MRQLRDLILARQLETQRTHLAALELQTRYLVQHLWAASGNAKRGQPEKAADGVKFYKRPRILPTIAQVESLGMGPAPPKRR